MVALLRSELEATRSQLQQKEVVARSLQRQLDQVRGFGQRKYFEVPFMFRILRRLC